MGSIRSLPDFFFCCSWRRVEKGDTSCRYTHTVPALVRKQDFVQVTWTHAKQRYQKGRVSEQTAYKRQNVRQREQGGRK